jgi:hypothetical protein
VITWPGEGACAHATAANTTTPGIANLMMGEA